MFSGLFMDLLAILGILVMCTLIAIVGLIFTFIVGGAIASIIGAFKNIGSGDNNNGST